MSLKSLQPLAIITVLSVVIVMAMHGKLPFFNGKTNTPDPITTEMSNEFNKLVNDIHGDEFVPEHHGFKAVEAWAQNDTVFYMDAQGQQMIKTGGTRAFRNNNPSNIEHKASTEHYPGVIGSDGRFCIFNTLANGTGAQYARLRSNMYGDSTIAAGIRKWCPPKERSGATNDTQGYIEYVQELTRLDTNLIIGTLSEQEYIDFISAMIRKEGGTKRGKSELIKTNEPNSLEL